MADLEQEVTPPIETTLLHSNPAPFSFRAEGVRLTQSGGRLIVVNYFYRGVLTWLLCIMSLLFPLLWLSSLHSWSDLYHHATWRTMLSAVLASDWQLAVDELCVLPLTAMFYWLLVTVGDLNGVLLNQRNGTAKVAGIVRPLTDLEAVRVAVTQIVGRPEPYSRCWIVQLMWSDERSLLWWQKLLTYKGPSKEPKTSLLGLFQYPTDVTDVEKLAQAVAEFAGIPVHHQTWIK